MTVQPNKIRQAWREIMVADATACLEILRHNPKASHRIIRSGYHMHLTLDFWGRPCVEVRCLDKELRPYLARSIAGVANKQKRAIIMPEPPAWPFFCRALHLYP